jgi:hypothetical protein
MEPLKVNSIYKSNNSLNKNNQSKNNSKKKEHPEHSFQDVVFNVMKEVKNT